MLANYDRPVRRSVNAQPHIKCILGVEPFWSNACVLDQIAYLAHVYNWHNDCARPATVTLAVAISIYCKPCDSAA